MTGKNPFVTIVIVNWNNVADTRDCLRSLLGIRYDNYSIVVVDNGSTSDDAAILRTEFGTSVTVIESGCNLGFSGGNNLGIAYAIEHGAEFVLLINNDTAVEPDFLSPLVEALEGNRQCGMTTPKVCFFSDPQLIWSAGGVLSEIRASGFSRGEGEDASKYSATEEVTFASGCCVLIRAAVLREVGAWDESYFLYVEDVDYCYRIIASGYRILYVGSSVIYHKVHRTTKSVHSLLPLYYTVRNRFFFKDKLGRKKYFLASAYLWSVLGLKCVWWTMKGRHDRVQVLIRAATDYKQGRTGYTDLSTNLEKDRIR